VANVFIVLLVISVLILGVYEAYAAWADPKASAVSYAMNWLNANTGFPASASTPTLNGE
jgi:hypothetical protein